MLASPSVFFAKVFAGWAFYQREASAVAGIEGTKVIDAFADL